jgi:hypothetical protein
VVIVIRGDKHPVLALRTFLKQRRGIGLGMDELGIADLDDTR